MVSSLLQNLKVFIRISTKDEYFLLKHSKIVTVYLYIRISLRDSMRTLFFSFGMLMGCDSMLFRANFDEEEPADLYTAQDLSEAPTDQDQLLILHYNIK